MGLDNIGVFDRSKPLPTGGFINQADGTSWMAMYCLHLMRIALELAGQPPLRDGAGKVVAGLEFLAVDGREGHKETGVEFGDKAVLASDGTHGTKAGKVLQRGQPGELGSDLGI